MLFSGADYNAAGAVSKESPKMGSDSRVYRHKAAIRRGEPSLPLKCLIRDRLLEHCESLFDYGCGLGEDVCELRQMGIQADGWDPAHRPHGRRRPADAVNLGYVLNVIEDAEERARILHAAWGLCRKVLSVAARVAVSGRGSRAVAYGDGFLTRIGTFQKYYSQAELRQYIEAELGQDAIPAAPGVFYIFQDAALQEQFLASRYRRRAAGPRKRISDVRFEEHRGILEPFMQLITELGRLPDCDEYDDSGRVIAAFGSLKQAFALIRRVTGTELWESLRERRNEDILVYLALANFRRRPRFSILPDSLQRDLRAFFGTYRRGCEQADTLLFKAGQAEMVDEACRRSPLGKLLPNALYIHRSALDELDPLLRIYEGCARTYLGDIEGANVIKLHRFSAAL